MTGDAMKKQVLYFVLFSFFSYGTDAHKSTGNTICVQDTTIADFIEKTKIECAGIIYELVHDAVIDAVVKNGASIYQKSKHVFSSVEMKQIVNLGRVYGSKAQLYRIAAQIAHQHNDIDAIIVLHVAAEETRQPWYKRHALIFGGLLALSWPLGDQIIKMLGQLKCLHLV